MTTPLHSAAIEDKPNRSASTQNGLSQSEAVRAASFDNGVDDAHWAPPRLSDVDAPKVSEHGSWEPTQVSKLQALMGVQGFEAAYIINSTDSTHSTIVGNRSSVSEAQISTVCSSLQVGNFEQFTLSLEHVHVLARRSPHMPDHACVMVIDRTMSNSTLAMNSLKKFCDELS